MNKKIINMQLYPKTTRTGNPIFQIIEKLDGSNLGFFRLNDDLIIAQRKIIYLLKDIDEIDKGVIYGSLYKFLKESGEYLLSKLINGSGFFCEWMAMGKLNYNGTLNKQMYMFAKANIASTDNQEKPYKITNLYWDRELLKYPFVNQAIPEHIGLPTLVAQSSEVSIEFLDKLYDEYVIQVGRPVEGFVIMSENKSISKYVRNKRGKLGPHKF